MQKLFFDQTISLAGYESTEEYILDSARNGWINFYGYEFFRDFVEKGLIVPGRTQVRTSNGFIDRCYFTVDEKTLEGNIEIAAHQGLPGRHSAREVLNDQKFCSKGWCVSSYDLAMRLRIAMKS